MMDEPTRGLIRLAAVYIRKAKHANQINDFAELKDEWDQIEIVIEQLVAKNQVQTWMIFTSLVLELERYCRVHGLHQQYLEWLRLIDISEIANNITDQDFAEFTETIRRYTSESNSPPETGDDILALYENHLAGNLIIVGKLREAEANLTRAMSRVQHTNKPSGKVAILINYGILKKHQGSFKEAVSFHQQAKTLAESIGNHYMAGAALGNLGETYRQMGRYPDAIKTLKEAIELANEENDLIGKGSRLGNLGSAYAQQHQYQAAKECYEEGRQIAERLGDRLGYSKRTANLGRVRYLLGEHDAGVELLQEGLAIKEELGNIRGQAEDQEWLGSVYFERGDIERGKEHYRIAANCYNTLGLPREANKVREILQLLTNHQESQDLSNLSSEDLSQFLINRAVGIAQKDDAIIRDIESLVIVNQSAAVMSSPHDFMRLQKQIGEAIISIANHLNISVNQANLHYLGNWFGEYAELLLVRIQLAILAKKASFTKWVFACAVGFGIGVVSFELLGQMGLITIGAILGFSQWLVLRKVKGVNFLWVVFSSVALAGATLLSPGPNSSPFLVGLLYGFVLGLAQFFLLPRVLKGGFLWPIANGIGFGICFHLANEIGLFLSANYLGSSWGGLVGSVAGGIALGMITGIVLRLLIHIS